MVGPRYDEKGRGDQEVLFLVTLFARLSLCSLLLLDLSLVPHGNPSKVLPWRSNRGARRPPRRPVCAPALVPCDVVLVQPSIAGPLFGGTWESFQSSAMEVEPWRQATSSEARRRAPALDATERDAPMAIGNVLEWEYY